MKIEGSESGSGFISQRHGSADPNPDPDPHQIVMDPQHCYAGCYERIARQPPGPRPRRIPRGRLPSARLRDDARRPRQANREYPRAPARPTDELRLVPRAHDRPRLLGDQKPVQPGGGRGDDQRHEAGPPAVRRAGRPAVAGPERQSKLASQSQLAPKQ
jgi:hypothetical protein